MISLNTVAPDRRPNTSTLLPLDQYDLFIISFSGGKDSLASHLRLRKLGVPASKIEWWHQDVDGRGPHFMDWPVTADYCRKVAAHLGITIRYQWKVGGFLGEMLRDNSLTQPTQFELPGGRIGQAGGKRGDLTTRRKFPQVSADLSVRWCSSYLKIDVASKAINNDPRFKRARICYISGERRQESAARSKYAEIERHRTSNRKRRVDHWRNVIDLHEQEIWDLIRESRIVPHPAYYLGWGRVSCLTCIFGGADQFASARKIAPQMVRTIADYEREFGLTIKRGKNVEELADEGTPYAQTDDEALVKLALSETYTGPVVTDDWRLPPGAFTHCGGPT